MLTKELMNFTVEVSQCADIFKFFDNIIYLPRRVLPLSRRFVRSSSETQRLPRGQEKRRDESIQARAEEPLATRAALLATDSYDLLPDHFQTVE